jgi:hypothetical protein
MARPPQFTFLFQLTLQLGPIRATWLIEAANCAANWELFLILNRRQSQGLGQGGLGFQQAVDFRGGSGASPPHRPRRGWAGPLQKTHQEAIVPLPLRPTSSPDPTREQRVHQGARLVPGRGSYGRIVNREFINKIGQSSQFIGPNSSYMHQYSPKRRAWSASYPACPPSPSCAAAAPSWPPAGWPWPPWPVRATAPAQ